MNIHVKLTGEAANAVEELVRRGYGANKTEAIRHAVLECKHLEQERITEDEVFNRKMSAYANRDIWDNKEDEKMAQWYMNRSKHESKKK